MAACTKVRRRHRQERSSLSDLRAGRGFSRDEAWCKLGVIEVNAVNEMEMWRRRWIILTWGDGWERRPQIVRLEEKKRGETPAQRTKRWDHPAALIVMVTCRLVGALGTGREDE